MKALDNRNATARKKANGNPYYKDFIDSEKACPYCDEFLKRTEDWRIGKCNCGEWYLDWLNSSWPYKLVKQSNHREEIK